MLDNREEVKQFMVLSEKRLEELQAICEGMQLPTTGTKTDLVNRLITLSIKPQTNILYPQAIPLRNKTDQGESLKGAVETFKQWRYLLYSAKTTKEFQLVNTQGEQYTMRMKYLLCPERTLRVIIQQRWVYPQSHQLDLVKMLAETPEKFHTHIVQKTNKDKRSWMMLHAAPKAA